MAFDDMDDLHLRIARVTEDLRQIQQELNCAAMQAPSDPELMEALNSLSETEPIETLRVALDQMRHFLWFYSEVMRNEPEFGDRMRQVATASAKNDSAKSQSSFFDKLSRVASIEAVPDRPAIRITLRGAHGHKLMEADYKIVVDILDDTAETPSAPQTIAKKTTKITRPDCATVRRGFSPCFERFCTTKPAVMKIRSQSNLR